jgi:DNA invertase Pin-like site-specific DNA recombinase
MNKRYFAYIRVSTTKQEEHSSSLFEQRSSIESYATKNGLTVCAWFEETETAAKRGRRAFTQMMAKLRAGGAQGLIIHKIDRGARNPWDWASVGDLIDTGFDVRFVSDNFDLRTRGGRLSADIQAVVAADYIRNLREEVKKGIAGRLKQGLYPFAAPVGYLNNGKGKLKTIDPIKGPLIQRLFERYATNTVNFDQLREEFWKLGLSARPDAPYSKNGLSIILHNPFYMGVIRIKRTGETYAGAHEPLIGRGLFERVQAIMEGKTVIKARTHAFLLRRRVNCDDCKRRTLTGEAVKGHVYYRCHSPTCRSAAWHAAELEQVVLDTLASISLTGEDIRDVGDLVAEELQNEEASVSTFRKSLSLRLGQIDARIDRLTDLLIDEAIDRDSYNDRKEQLLKERQDLLTRLNDAHLRSPLATLYELFERKNTSIFQYETLAFDEKRELIDSICSNFSVSGKTAAFTLLSPYREIAELPISSSSALQRDEVRIKRIFDILKSVAQQQIASAATSPTSLRPGASDSAATDE